MNLTPFSQTVQDSVLSETLLWAWSPPSGPHLRNAAKGAADLNQSVASCKPIHAIISSSDPGSGHWPLPKTLEERQLTHSLGGKRPSLRSELLCAGSQHRSEFTSVLLLVIKAQSGLGSSYLSARMTAETQPS